MSATVYPLNQAKLNVTARKLRDLGVNPPMATLTELLAELYQDAYASGLNAGRMDIERRPFERNYEPQHRQFNLKPSGEV